MHAERRCSSCTDQQYFGKMIAQLQFFQPAPRRSDRTAVAKQGRATFLANMYSDFPRVHSVVHEHSTGKGCPVHVDLTDYSCTFGMISAHKGPGVAPKKGRNCQNNDNTIVSIKSCSTDGFNFSEAMRAQAKHYLSESLRRPVVPAHQVKGTGSRSNRQRLQHAQKSSVQTPLLFVRRIDKTCLGNVFRLQQNTRTRTKQWNLHLKRTVLVQGSQDFPNVPFCQRISIKKAHDQLCENIFFALVGQAFCCFLCR